MGSTTNTDYQTVNFHFKVQFDFDQDGNSIDVSFQSVTGLDSTLETETVKEGGENRFTHVLPVRRKFGPLVLKRGLLTQSSTLTKRLKMAFENDTFTPFKLVTIHLLDETHQSLMHDAAFHRRHRVKNRFLPRCLYLLG